MKDLVRVVRRIAITVVGAVILAVGVVMLVAPGPGLLVILAALVVFAVEYEWARRHLATVRGRALSAAEKAAASRVAKASALLFGSGAIALGAVLVFTDLLPLSGVGTGISVAIGGLTVLGTMAYSIRESRRADRAASTGAGPTATPSGEPGAQTAQPQHNQPQHAGSRPRAGRRWRRRSRDGAVTAR
jgi:hypothetical protein